MATITNLLRPSEESGGRLRPFDVQRDLGPVADLVEQCFADTLDPDGERYLQHMRSAAQNPGLMRWAAAAADWSALPLSGYVWEEDGRLVGNVSLIPYHIHSKRQYLVANVGVHPSYRRRGIARRLTLQAIEHARRKGAPAVWLHVRENNPGAIRLYQDLNFVERARRTTWYSAPELPAPFDPLDLVFAARRSEYWAVQSQWLRNTYPSELTWHLPLNLGYLRPGLWGALYRTFNAAYVQQWALRRQGKLIGTLAWQAEPSHSNLLWLAAAPDSEDLAARALLVHARHSLSPRRPLTLDYPAHQAEAAIRAAGFYIHQTLIWMALDF